MVKVMKLRYSPTSPYVRKVTVTAIETGLHGRIERVPTALFRPGCDIDRDNPLGKIPALISGDGMVLYDSAVICEYLDSLHDGAKLFPPTGRERWTALRRQALADGLADAAVLRKYETWRPREVQSEDWLAHQRGKMERALDALEAEAGALDGALTIGHVAMVCVLDWLDLRFPEDPWRPSRPRLAGWLGGISKRRSFIETFPEDPNENREPS